MALEQRAHSALKASKAEREIEINIGEASNGQKKLLDVYRDSGKKAAEASLFFRFINHNAPKTKMGIVLYLMVLCGMAYLGWMNLSYRSQLQNIQSASQTESSARGKSLE